MLSLPPSVRVYLATEPVDMRKSIDGLAAVVKSQWRLAPDSGHLFVFLGRRRDRVKVLFFDTGGYVLYYKRLELGRFRLPVVPDGASQVKLESTDLVMLLRGIDFSRVRRPVPWMPDRETMGTPPPQLALDRRGRS